MTDVFIEPPDNQNWFVVRSRYDPGVVDIVKGAPIRTYNPSDKTWRVLGQSSIDDVARQLESAGHTVYRDGTKPEPTPPPASGKDFWGEAGDEYDANSTAAEILATIPAEHRGKVFRAMARQLYPDLYARRR